jgi:hypothetical protein
MSDDCRFASPACKKFKECEDLGAEENTMSLKTDEINASAVSPRARRTAGRELLLAVKHGHGDLLPDLDLVRIGDVACGGNVGIVVGRPVKAVAYLR